MRALTSMTIQDFLNRKQVFKNSNLNDLRLNELRTEYKNRGMKNYSKLKKQELIDKIKEFDRCNNINNNQTERKSFSTSNTECDFAKVYNLYFHEYTKELLDDERLNLYLLNLKVQESSFFKLLRKGDVICLDPQFSDDINNNGKVIWNGERCMYLDFNIVDNGSVKPEFYVYDYNFHPFYWKPALNNNIFFLEPRLLRSLRFTTTNFTTRFTLSGILYRWKVIVKELLTEDKLSNFPLEKEENVNLLRLRQNKAYYCDSSNYNSQDNNTFIHIIMWNHYENFHVINPDKLN